MSKDNHQAGMRSVALEDGATAQNIRVKIVGGGGDLVNHPAHYNMGKIEVIDAIEDWQLDYKEGCVIKYVARAKHKGSELQDLKKARWYLDRAIAKLETAQELPQREAAAIAAPKHRPIVVGDVYRFCGGDHHFQVQDLVGSTPAYVKCTDAGIPPNGGRHFEMAYVDVLKCNLVIAGLKEESS